MCFIQVSVRKALQLESMFLAVKNQTEVVSYRILILGLQTVPRNRTDPSVIMLNVNTEKFLFQIILKALSHVCGWKIAQWEAFFVRGKKSENK